MVRLATLIPGYWTGQRSDVIFKAHIRKVSCLHISNFIYSQFHVLQYPQYQLSKQTTLFYLPTTTHNNNNNNNASLRIQTLPLPTPCLDRPIPQTLSLLAPPLLITIHTPQSLHPHDHHNHISPPQLRHVRLQALGRPEHHGRYAEPETS